MPWQILVMLILMVPIVLLPVAFVWYLNIGGFISLMKNRCKKVKQGI